MAETYRSVTKNNVTCNNIERLFIVFRISFCPELHGQFAELLLKAGSEIAGRREAYLVAYLGHRLGGAVEQRLGML